MGRLWSESTDAEEYVSDPEPDEPEPAAGFILGWDGDGWGKKVLMVCGRGMCCVMHSAKP